LLRAEHVAGRVALQFLGSVKRPRRSLSVTDGRWRLAFRGPQTKLFDLVADPDSMDDSSALHPEIVTRLTRASDAFLASHSSTMIDGVRREFDARARRALGNLGYVEGAAEER
jgi:hypothetical protein